MQGSQDRRRGDLIKSLVVDEQLVRRLARLARLSLSDDEVVYYTSRFAKIISYVESLQDLSEHLGSENIHSEPREREDRIHPSLPVETSLREAQNKRGSSFMVPRVVDS